MKTQIPRSSDQPNLRYSGVYEQLGRMIDAADWNELVEILKRHFAETLTDAVGSGVPRDRGLALIQGAPGAEPEIQRGVAYADGVFGQVIPNADDPEATLFDIASQYDFPKAPALPGSIANLCFYVDIWERAVLANEDGGLMDPGLYGADTCTRTQTMAQVKWCPAEINPELESDNPKMGSSLLDLTLRQELAQNDSCDPCAAEVNRDVRVGNYLFRMEVHDVVGDHNQPTSLTLKWSVENAAEQHAVGGEPEDFKSGDWVYEFYSTTDDRHLGLHHASGFSPERGVLLKEYPADPVTDPETSGKRFVRRWDGFLTLNRNGAGVWSIALNADGEALGVDNGLELKGDRRDSDPAYIALSSSLVLNVATLDVELQLEEVSFLAGDYWLGMIREAVHDPADEEASIILVKQLPQGVAHHYLQLGETDASGNLDNPIDTDRWRRLNFPPLTDLQSYDVGYEKVCGELFTDKHDTVKKALDRLCELAAEHIGYSTDCPSGLFTSEHGTVKKALDQICHIQATHIGYRPSEDCELLKDADTVWEALDILCKHNPAGGGGCKVTVGKNGGQFATLREAFGALKDKEEACICLLPGVHKVKGLVVKSPRIVSITGCGEGTRIDVSDSGFRFGGLDSLALEGIQFNLQDEAVLDVTSCTKASITTCYVSGTPSRLALVNLNKVEKITLARNHFEGLGSKSTNIYLPFVGTSEPLVAYFSDSSTTTDRAGFARSVGKDLESLSSSGRKAITKEMRRLVKDGEESGELSSEEAGRVEVLIEVLAHPTPSAARIASVLGTLDDFGRVKGSVPVLQIHNASEDVTLTDNRIEGTFLLYDGSDGSFLPDLDEMTDFVAVLRKDRVLSFGSQGRFCMTRNEVTCMSLGNELIQKVRDLLEDKVDRISGVFSHMLFADNTFVQAGSRVMGRDISLQGNVFLAESSDMASFMADRLMVIGNSGSSSDVNFVHSFSREHKPALNLSDMNFVFVKMH